MEDEYVCHQELDEFIGMYSVTVYLNGQRIFHCYRKDRIKDKNAFIEAVKEARDGMEKSGRKA